MLTRPSLWRVMFLSEKYGRMTLTLDEVAQQIGIAAGTIKNRRGRGEFTWIRSDGRALYADVRGVADYLAAQEWAEHCKSDRIVTRSARRSIERRQRPAWADRDAIKAVYAQAIRRSRETGIPHHVDHEIPLQGKLVSGLHVATNLQVLPWYENVAKNNRFEIE
jgi:hypothetical protein